MYHKTLSCVVCNITNIYYIYLAGCMNRSKRIHPLKMSPEDDEAAEVYWTVCTVYINLEP